MQSPSVAQHGACTGMGRYRKIKAFEIIPLFFGTGDFFVFQGRSLALMCGNEERDMWIDRSCALMMSFQPEQAQHQERRGENLKSMVCRQENSLLAQNIVIKINGFH